ncbi:MAG: hypothetical protein IJW58_00945 [Clostridia bacterium]|nr:hypothetical protein [Clostridia bacterium]
MKETKDVNNVTKNEMLTDFQALLNEFYVGNAEKTEDGLTLTLANGQQFLIKVEAM